MRSAHGWDYEVETCSARQRTFLWQVSQPGCTDAAAMSTRYLRFLGLMRAHGYSEHFFVPSYDIDFAWHTHMLTSTSDYLRETELLANAPGGVDHDDSVNQRHEDSKLHQGWADTKAMWALDHFGASDPIDQAGVTYAASRPTGGSRRTARRSSACATASCRRPRSRRRSSGCGTRPTSAAARRSGLDMVCQVSGDVMRRLQEQLDAEEHRLRGTSGPTVRPSHPHGRRRWSRRWIWTTRQQRRSTSWWRCLRACAPPRRACLCTRTSRTGVARGSTGGSASSTSHASQPARSSWSTISPAPSTRSPSSRDASAAGRMPDSRTASMSTPRRATAMTVVAVAQAADLASYRCMLGPMAFRQPAGADSGGDELMRMGGCGGGGCGGGGCGGGGCGGGGGEPPIKDSETVRIIGLSKLQADVLDLAKGTAIPTQ